MGLKERIKKSLYVFFKDEIEESLQLSDRTHIAVVPQIEHRVLEYQELCAEIRFSPSDMNFGQDPYAYEKLLDKCRQELFREVMKYVKVEEQNLIDPRLRNARGVFMSIFVGKNSK